MQILKVFPERWFVKYRFALRAHDVDHDEDHFEVRAWQDGAARPLRDAKARRRRFSFREHAFVFFASCFRLGLWQCIASFGSRHNC